MADGGRDAGGLDGGAFDAGVPDAGSTPRDAAPDACPSTRPAVVYLLRTALAIAPGESRVCTDASGQYRARLYRRGETTPAVDLEGPSCVTVFGAVAAGEYDLVMERTDDPRWIVGAAIVRPESCPPGLRPTPPYCPPIRLSLAPCDDREVFATLHCDPNVSPEGCPSYPWPWLEPAP